MSVLSRLSEPAESLGHGGLLLFRHTGYGARLEPWVVMRDMRSCVVSMWFPSAASS